MESVSLERVLTVREVAEHLRTSEGYVYRLISNGDLRCVRLGTRAVRVPESALAEFIGGE